MNKNTTIHSVFMKSLFEEQLQNCTKKVMKHAKLQTVHPSIYLSVHPAYKQRKRTSKLFPYFQCFRYNCSKYYWPLFPILEFPVNIRKKKNKNVHRLKKKYFAATKA